MDAFRVNPPLPRMAATIPVMFSRSGVPWYERANTDQRIEFLFAGQLCRSRSPEDLRALLRRSRLCMFVFYLTGAWSAVRWATALYGTQSGTISLALWCFSPNVLTLCAVVGPDGPAAATGLLAGYSFWKWLHLQKPRVPYGCGLAVGIAVSTKFSWLCIFPLFTGVTIFHALNSRSDVKIGVLTMKHRLNRCASQIFRLWIGFAISLFVLNATYGFDGFGQPLGRFRFVSNAFSSGDGMTNRWTDTWVSPLPVPLPTELLRGIDYLQWELEEQKLCYLSGEWQIGGWWYFYLFAILIKMPIGFLALIVFGSVELLLGFQDRSMRRKDDWILAIIAVAFISMFCLSTGFTHDVRYVVPAFGFLFILASRIGLLLQSRLVKTIVGVSFASVLMSHIIGPGFAHTHFNYLGGGPHEGWRQLSFANSDWGQSTYRLADWAERNPDKRPLTIIFRSNLGDPGRLVESLSRVYCRSAVNGKKISLRHRPGWYLVSTFQMTLPENRWLHSAQEYPFGAGDAKLLFVAN